MAPKRVLLLTNSEHGQANVFLATSYALLTSFQHEDVEVHFASFPAIEKAVASTSDHARRTNPSARPIVFHPIDGIDMVSAWSRPELTAERESLKTVDTVQLVYAIRRMKLLLKVTLPWNGPEFVQIMDSIGCILAATRPAVVAVDPAFSPALTALRHLRQNFIVLSPNSIKDFAMPMQPDGEPLWKYPCIGSPDTFPVPASHIPANILLVLLAIILAGFFDSHRRAIETYVRTHTAGAARLTTLNDLSLNPGLGIRFLVANLPEMEFPLAVLPGYILPCGPMLRPYAPLEEADPTLAKWIARGPTVYVNLGTHLFLDENFAVEMATALRIMLERVRGVLWRDDRLQEIQVLWKLMRRGEYEVEGPGSRVGEILGEEMKSGRVKIVEWIDAEPLAVLERDTVICAVHHGGANSFLEAVSAGIPQVVLPVWMDTYDFARRAEILGIGRWGNQQTQGAVCRGDELGAALVDVLIGGRSSLYTARAKELAKLCKRSGGGRVVAARRILAEILDVFLGLVDRRLGLVGRDLELAGRRLGLIAARRLKVPFDNELQLAIGPDDLGSVPHRQSDKLEIGHGNAVGVQP
ncbi:hypothetical protein QBC47DRAFT_439886 [Echria macrotheca]|uniref:Erythromycin biosynthesis protein CIII-like C-terminal domain-containing protein n=1 Tax=Echria macrotheca TaxID=438768 RepID=A0AAJ0F074_9PEZI|nr:hypothetical protein QBC47DRAFT_439886 [Echria macrotheca]